MDIAKGLMNLGFEPLVDFIAEDDGDGPYLKEWLSALPQPSQSAIEQAAAQTPVPEWITPLQARRALTAAGMRSAVDNYVAALDQDSKDAWEYATIVHRDNAIIAAGAAALGLTTAQVDDLFRLGTTL